MPSGRINPSLCYINDSLYVIAGLGETHGIMRLRLNEWETLESMI